MRIHKPGLDAHDRLAGSKGKPDKADAFSKILAQKRTESIAAMNVLGENPNSELPAPHSENVATAPASLDIERLASEIVDHISSHQAAGTKSVDIQFNSQTLEGLRVTIQSQQGSIAINFLTPVTRIASVVQKNLATLRTALENKGVPVSEVRVVRWAG